MSCSTIQLTALLALMTIASPLAVRADDGSHDERTAVYLVDPEAAAQVRHAIRSGHRQRQPIVEQLRERANKALLVAAHSVVEKRQVPPSGDRHDYFSLARYWWPNPSTPDGLPYVWRDGEVNPEIDRVPDKRVLYQMISAVQSLAWGYYLFGEERYAEHAMLLLRTFFLDRATRMNPNLQFAQVVRGRDSQAKGSGIIDGRNLVLIPEAVSLLAASRSLRPEDERGLRQWFESYLGWLQSSPRGRLEAGSRNNHRTFYITQVAALSLYLGRRDQAMAVLRQEATMLLDRQIELDGSQPRELARTKPVSYSTFNLQAWARLATLARNVGVDLWSHRGPDGRGSLRAAISYVVAYVSGARPWMGPPLGAPQLADLAAVLARAGCVYGEAHWLALAGKLASGNAETSEPEDPFFRGGRCNEG